MTSVAAVVQLAFDPMARIADAAVRWEALGVAAAILVALVAAGLIAGRSGGSGVGAQLPALRRDDLLYVALGAAPGAVIGGRIFHGLAYLDVYGRDPLRLLDPSRGSLSLLGAVLGGTLTGGYIALLLGGETRRWADIAAAPLLLAIGLGKAAQLLGGGGQGAPFDGPWAVAFQGGGPWLSTAPDIPAHPSQVYEGLWCLVGALLLLSPLGRGVTRSSSRWESVAGRRGAIRGGAGRGGSVPAWWAPPVPSGRRYIFAVAWWLVGRFTVAFSWRDDPVLGPLNFEQAAIAVIAIAFLAALVLRLLVGGRNAYEGRRIA